jgi:hypothetical protein
VTAGVVAMNAGAAAIAADSAVTIPFRRGAKHYRGACKIIALHRDEPVGVFWYGDAEYQGVPWEVLLKDYRAQASATCARLEEYAQAMWGFVDTETPQWNVDPSTEPAAAATVRGLFDKVERAAGGLSGDARDAVVQKVVNRWAEDRRPVARVLADEQVNDCDNLWTWFNERLEELESEVGPLGGTARAAALDAWARLSAREPGHSGIVVVGYGTAQRTPSLCHYLIGPPACGLPRRVGASVVSIGSNRPAAIVPFAQNDVVRLFIEGIDPTLQEWFIGTLERLESDYGIPSAAVEQLAKRLTNEINHHGQPVIEAVRFLPKADLAEFARSLIAFTAFRLKMSLADESVAEPIDVAVISRSEGLVWVHRTHYFEMDQNPHFARRYR